jgi:hypothetical protein
LEVGTEPLLEALRRLRKFYTAIERTSGPASVMPFSPLSQVSGRSYGFCPRQNKQPEALTPPSPLANRFCKGRLGIFEKHMLRQAASEKRHGPAVTLG